MTLLSVRRCLTDLAAFPLRPTLEQHSLRNMRLTKFLTVVSTSFVSLVNSYSRAPISLIAEHQQSSLSRAILYAMRYLEVSNRHDYDTITRFTNLFELTQAIFVDFKAVTAIVAGSIADIDILSTISQN